MHSTVTFLSPEPHRFSRRDASLFLVQLKLEGMQMQLFIFYCFECKTTVLVRVDVGQVLQVMRISLQSDLQHQPRR
jgi:hypothetical protein